MSDKTRYILIIKDHPQYITATEDNIKSLLKDALFKTHGNTQDIELFKKIPFDSTLHLQIDGESYYV